MSAAASIITWAAGALGIALGALFIAWACASVRARNRAAAAHWKSVMDTLPGSAREFPPPSRDPYVVKSRSEGEG